MFLTICRFLGPRLICCKQAMIVTLSLHEALIYKLIGVKDEPNFTQTFVHKELLEMVFSKQEVWGVFHSWCIHSRSVFILGRVVYLVRIAQPTNNLFRGIIAHGCETWMYLYTPEFLN